MSGIRRVVVGASGSPGSLRALRYAENLARAHSATLIPVLAWVPPGGNLPSASAVSIMVRAGRSLIEPDGLALSSLRKSRHGPRSMRVTSMRGVEPMRSRTDAMSK